MTYPQLDHEATMPAVLRRAAARFGPKPFVVDERATVSFTDVERRSRRLARRLLAAGVGKGTRVGIHHPNGTEWVIAWAAASRVGALVMPFSTLYAPLELGAAVRLGDIHLLLAPDVMFGRDHQQFLERAIAGLDAAAGGPLHLPAAPYLRAVMLSGRPTAAWAVPVHDDTADHVSDELLAAVEREVVPADEMLVIFTSGTTSEPKAVVHTHGAVIRKTSIVTPGVPPPGGCAFVGQAFFWVGGILNLGSALQHGSTIVCQEKPDAGAALELIERTRPSMVIAWNSTVQRLRAHPSFPSRDLRFLPQLTMGGGADPELRHNSLGMTETIGPHTGGPRPGASDDEAGYPLPERLRGSWGAPVPHLEHRIVDPVTGEPLDEGAEGELCVRGFSLMSGMYKRERHEVFDDDGWYRTGDRGYFRDGYLFFTGRYTDMIKTHGANVAPREVELALESLDEVALAFVMGAPDAERGEIVVAALVGRDDEDVDVGSVRARLAERLSAYKVPRELVVLRDDEVPWLGSGKPDRLAIRAVVFERVGRGAPS